MFPAVVQTENPSHRLLHFMDGTSPHRPTGCAFLVREMDLETVGVLVTDTGLREVLARPAPEAREVPAEHVQLRLTLHDPFRRKQTKAARLREARDDPVAAEVVAQFRHRAEQGA